MQLVSKSFGFILGEVLPPFCLAGQTDACVRCSKTEGQKCRGNTTEALDERFNVLPQHKKIKTTF